MNGILDNEMNKWGACVIIPAYNNGRFLPGVLADVARYTSAIIVVNDGSTDNTAEILARSPVTVITLPRNKGKGRALAKGFDHARQAGYRNAITMDADGQHAARDLPRFLQALDRHPGAMIIGCRPLEQENMPGKNTFANRFSNFWFAVQTGRYLPDTQTGFRLYPLERLKGTRSITSRYEAELEWLVRTAWKNIPQVPVPVDALYLPAGERVTHFRPVIDFLRVSLLNTCLVLAAILYGYPSRIARVLYHRKR